jgi:DNA-binding transcriptional ArsR family regulator
MLDTDREREMTSTALFAEIAALAGDPARVGMLHALMDGRALTATELANAAGVAPQTASGHLARMTAIGLLSVERQGRHRYHRLATPAIARMLESIMHVAAELQPRGKPLSIGPKDIALRRARTCYDHFAGRLGVSLTDAMTEKGLIELTSDAGVVTEAGIAFLKRLGIDTAPILARRTKQTGRVLCRPCLDWSERRPHLGGVVGAALCAHSLEMGWVQRMPGTRAVRVTPKGERILRDKFDVALNKQ